MEKTIGIIGGGNMGMAILSRIVKKYQVEVCEQDDTRANFLRRKFKTAVKDLQSLVADSSVIIVAVKPQDIDSVLEGMGRVISDKKLVISIAAGVTTAFLEKELGGRVKVIRAMPNLPAQIAESVTAVCAGRYATSIDVKTVCKIFDCIGETIVLAEDLIDSVTAVSGSGPAYVFLFAECLIAAAESLGLTKDLSKKLVMKTLLGSIHLLERQREDPASLRARVTSKGGTTQAAMDVFARRELEKIFIEALSAARLRAGELSKK
jgi:pyrroline-5-carboxylate reductase